MGEFDQVIHEFVVESGENLDQLERDLITIEADPANHGTFERIFRTLHSIKGACGFLAFPSLESVAHAGESLLSGLSEGRLDWRPEMTSGLLTLVDAVRRMLARIDATGSEGDE